MSQVDLSATTHPVADYSEAAHRIDTIGQRDGADILPVARTQFMPQGRKTERAIVLLHSLSNSPEQFYELGKRFFEYGYNVLIPRMPYHGSLNRMTDDQARLTDNDLIGYLNEATDIAQGLGKHITVAGQALGGVLAGMCAQYRRDVDLAALIGPTFGLWGLPPGISVSLGRALLRLPNLFIWWDALRGPRYGPDYIYPRVSTHALAYGLQLAHTVVRTARQMKPASRSILVVTHNRDLLASGAATAEVVSLWKQQGAEVRTHQFSGLPRLHDIIGPWSIGPRMEIVYAMLMNLITTDQQFES